MIVNHKYEMTLDLNVLNHLGINLYSNAPAVLAEAVANSWDADADNVLIQICKDTETIVISDDGHGMSVANINLKFLKVGYERREEENPVTPKYNRPVMGRKGIGKLSLFSIADTIEVQSSRGGEANGFTMSLPDIRATIKDKRKDNIYHPIPISQNDLDIAKGTKIVLKNLRKSLTQTVKALRRRLARRFTVIDPKHHFSVLVNGDPINIADRDYYNKLQYVWHYGDYGSQCLALCKNAEQMEKRDAASFEGWIGTVKESGQSKDGGESLNKIVVIVRGKLAQEDILETFGETGLYTKFIIGEVRADFLDEDDKADIATTSRQSIIEEDPRFLSLKEAIGKELKNIQSQ